MDNFDQVNLDLAESLKRCAEGDRSAFKTIYDLTAPKLNAIIFGMVRDEQMTYDILQLAYMSVWKNAGSFDASKGKPFTWILVVTRNRALDVLRKKKRLGVTEEVPETLQDKTMCSDDGARSWMLRRLLLPHLSNLSPDTTNAIIMSVVQGMSSREIGEKLGVPTNTVKSWVRRGLAKLRKDLGDIPIDALL